MQDMSVKNREAIEEELMDSFDVDDEDGIVSCYGGCQRDDGG